MNRHGGAFPGRSTIASGASLSVRAVDAALERLESAGYVVIDPPKRRFRSRSVVSEKLVLRRPGGKKSTNGYAATLPQTANPVHSLEWAMSEPEAPRSEADALKTNQPRPKTPKTPKTARQGRRAPLSAPPPARGPGTMWAVWPTPNPPS